MITSGSTRAHEIERIAQYYGVTISELEIKYQQTYFLFPRSCPGPFAKITARGTAATMPALVGFRDMVKAIEGAKVPSSTIKKLDDGEFGGLLVAVFAVK
jgi:hypothetical protein